LEECLAQKCRCCTHREREAIDGAILAGDSLRAIAGRFGVAKSSVDRHRPHIVEKARQIERDFSLRTVRDITSHMARLQGRVERLVLRLEKRDDHRTTLAGLRELREGFRVLAD
jgi:hypothetical protein